MVYFSLMAKDYFQDILPPDDSGSRKIPSPAPQAKETRIPINTQPAASAPAPVQSHDDDATAERSIRNISVQRKARTPDVRDAMPGMMVSSPRKGGGRWLLWTGAIASVAVLGILFLVALRSTTVEVTPRAQTITFNSASQFTAYPANAGTGALSYTARTLDLEDSEVVKSTGTVHAEDKASGTITVYNNFQTAPFKLVKNTRFQSANGLIFRTPADVSIPGKSGNTPGQVTITVVADQAGESYNVAPGKFTVPGLKGGASYAGIYAQSTQAFTGGFKGDRPGVSDSDKAAALAAVRSRLESKARASIDNATDGSIVLPDLVQITYTEDAPTQEAGGGVRLHEKAHVAIPSFPADQFAAVVGTASGITDSGVTFVPGSDFTAQILNASSTVGAGPLQFSLAGSATIVWKIDVSSLQKALAGKEQAAFQDIVKQFSGIQEAHARVEPFWRSTFPVDPAAIEVSVGDAKGQ